MVLGMTKIFDFFDLDVAGQIKFASDLINSLNNSATILSKDCQNGIELAEINPSCSLYSSNINNIGTYGLNADQLLDALQVKFKNLYYDELINMRLELKVKLFALINISCEIKDDEGESAYKLTTFLVGFLFFVKNSLIKNLQSLNEDTKFLETNPNPGINENDTTKYGSLYNSYYQELKVKGQEINKSKTSPHHTQSLNLDLNFQYNIILKNTLCITFTIATIAFVICGAIQGGQIDIGALIVNSNIFPEITAILVLLSLGLNHKLLNHKEIKETEEADCTPQNSMSL